MNKEVEATYCIIGRCAGTTVGLPHLLRTACFSPKMWV